MNDKKVSFGNKMKLAFISITMGEFIMLLFSILIFVVFFLGSMDNAKESGEAFLLDGLPLYYIYMVYIFSAIIFFWNIKMYKAMPLKFKDMLDIYTIKTFIIMIIFFAPQILLELVTGNTGVIPYSFFTNVTIMALNYLMTPIYSPQNGKMSVTDISDKKTKKMFALGVAVAIVYSVFILSFANIMMKLPSLGKPVSEHIWIFAAETIFSVAAFAVTRKICMKTKFKMYN